MVTLTLDNFYRSKDWEKLVRVLKMERLNEEGELICQHCGKPIIKQYDAIAHHTVFLTDENVNDRSVSLNPDIIQFVHHRCHNYIHNKFGYKRREVFLVYGSPLSGKSTWVSENAEPGDLIVDINRIWSCVSGLDLYTKPSQLNGVVFRIRDELMNCIKYRVGKWNNAYIVGGFPLISERERICKEYGAREVFIECPAETCMRRLADTEDCRDKDLWTEYIASWFERYTPPSDL